MALTRTALREKGITEKEILDYIMEEHGNTVEAAKEKAKETAETAMQKTIDTLQAKVDSLPAADGEDWKARYDAEVIAHTATKTAHETEKTIATKRDALRSALKAEGANEKLIDLLESKFSIDTLEMDGDAIKGWVELVKPVKEQYSEVFGTVQTVGAGVATPPKAATGGNNWLAQLEAARKANNTLEAVRIKAEAAKDNIFLI